MTQAIKQEVLDAIGSKFLQGDTFRMRHRFKLDGSKCSKITDDPAMVVTRISNGFVFHCHRCHAHGMINYKNMSPGQTRKRIAALKKIPIDKSVVDVELPYDYITMGNEVDHTVIPYSAWHWLWQYQFTNDEMLKYNIGYSSAYNRVIIPMYEFAEMGDDVAKKLVGWVGRELKYKSKAERKKAGVPKYLTRTKKGKRRYFMTTGDKDTVVICEDCLSAIRVHEATGYCCFALLNTDVGDNLMRWLTGKKVYLWLDPDMLAESVKKVDRMRQLGIDTKRISTSKDPKCYNSLFVRDTLKGSINE